MWTKIVCILLTLQVGGSFAAPSASPLLKRSKRGDDSGSAEESCCARRRRMVEIGPDISNVSLHVDIGQCVHCNHQLVDTTSNSSLPVLPAISTECGSGKECVIKHTSSRVFNLFSGPVTVNIIKDCNCQGIPSKCRRRKRFVTYFEGSSFEQTIDVGECMGGCSAFGLRKSCLAIENKTEVISGPNGKICVPVVSSCECVRSCHRLSMNEQHLEIFTDSKGQTQQRWKTIDVGQCVGYCDIRPEDILCALKSPDGRCLLPLNPVKESCVPVHHTQETFLSSHQQTKNVLRITGCGCKQL